MQTQKIILSKKVTETRETVACIPYYGKGLPRIVIVGGLAYEMSTETRQQPEGTQARVYTAVETENGWPLD